MAIKLENHIIKGILRDLSRSKFSPEFAFDALNIRLTAREGNTLLSVTNEKGTKECILKNSNNEEVTIAGDYIGHCVLNNYLVLFTIPEYGYGNIYRLEDKNEYFEVFELYSGPINFNIEYPIETLGVIEGKEIYKVYWTDNLNPIRVINISVDKEYNSSYNFNLVRFSSSLNLNITKLYGSGSFSSGVIQYACTYYSLYGSESNIFALSDLNYCSFEDRGASPEETVACSFKITTSTSNPIRNDYDYIRIYSIHRTSLNATPEVKIVADVSIKDIPTEDGASYVFHIDNGVTGEIIDPTILQYIGGENLVAKTLTSKDNTLFAGNIKLYKKIIPESIRTEIKKLDISFNLNSEFPLLDYDTVYSNKNLLSHNSNKIKGFKARECYRFGILFKSEEGNWSEVVFIKDATCNVSPNIVNYSSYAKLLIPVASITIPSNIVRLLVTSGYISMRGVCVYPDFNDRNIICQGVLCPTVFNVYDRCDNSPYALSSWFTRPIQANDDWKAEYLTSQETPHDITNGEVLFFNHYECIHNGIVYGSSEELGKKEISRAEVLNSLFVNPTSRGDATKNQISNFKSSFFVDNNIVTMYSPDIEFDNSIGYMKDASYKFRIVGAVLMANTASDISVTTSTTGFYNRDLGFFSNLKENPSIYNVLSASFPSGRAMSTSAFWGASAKFSDKEDDLKLGVWPIFPWHRSGSLIASGVPEEGEKLLWTLKRKILSNLWFSNRTVFSSELEMDISNVNTWHSGDGLIKITNTGDIDNSYYTYYGDIDKVVNCDISNNSRVDADGNTVYGYDIYWAYTRLLNEVKLFNKYASPIRLYKNTAGETITGRLKGKDTIGVEPVSMKYKSGPHAVFSFKFDSEAETPTAYILPNLEGDSGNYWWTTKDTTYIAKSLEFDNPLLLAYLWLGELYRETVNNRFGGDSELAILNNTWEVASDEVRLDEIKDLKIEYSGDTYTQRYDALRTYEYTSEDTNSIVDILSFMCETRVNIDGRYDRNRGNISNLTTTPLNFNLLNPVYNLRNNYFTYHTLDYSRFSNDYFPNTIVWSKEKSNAELIDTWTNLNMLSSLDLDGDKGEIESLNTFNNEIYCFQKKGLSNILFNSRVQVLASDGVPIELTNGLKVGGKRYVSNTIGCTNKWSIALTPAGLYFIDNETNSLYLFNGQVQSLSDKLGFRLWIGENNSHELWNPTNYKNFRTYYDKNNDDLYFINDKSCLCYSELLNQFTSFMSYEKVPAMFNINSEFYSFNKGKLWHNFEGDYNMFYGEFKPYSITVVANSDEPYDKIFNTVEFRSDSWNNDELINNQTFDTLEVWNEYLHGSSKLEFNKFIPSVLKKKFRVWRANIPRDDSNHRDRIRNTWAYIKLSMNTPNTWRTEFHDMNIHYFI